MPNPINGAGSSPEEDAFFLGVAERYQALLEQDQAIIEGLPLAFNVKNSVFATVMQARTIQRYFDLVGQPMLPFGVGDAILLTIGNAGTLQILRAWGYVGSDDFRMMLGFLARVEQEQRARLVQSSANLNSEREE